MPGEDTERHSAPHFDRKRFLGSAQGELGSTKIEDRRAQFQRRRQIVESPDIPTNSGAVEFADRLTDDSDVRPDGRAFGNRLR